MTLTSFLIFLVVFAVVAYLAYWVITKFFPAPAQMPALAIIGVVLLIVLISQFLPDMGSFKILR